MAQLVSSAHKQAAKRHANAFFVRAEEAGLFEPTRGFVTSYEEHYPELKTLELAHPAIQEECIRVLEMKDRLTEVGSLGGGHTSGGIQAIAWKSLMLKSGSFIEPNCRFTPKTTAFLRRIPGLYTACFSIIEPHQHITPRWGYWKGFLRYHLGVLMPDDNERGDCWIRLNSDPHDNRASDESLVERGQKHCWRNGKGVLFDDTNLHDAYNGSDRARVILWLDVRRKMPAWLQAINTACLEVAHREPSIARIRRKARIA